MSFPPPAAREAATAPAPAATGSAAMGSTWSAEAGGVRALFGAGALDRLGELARELGGTRALVVTDPGVAAAGHAARALASLAAAGLECLAFDAVGENPTTEEVEAGRDAAARHGADLLVGLGGGSAMDCAKGINLLLTQGGRLEDFWVKNVKNKEGRALAKPTLPSVGVPTTAGTGSEAQSYALLSQAGSHRKMACGDREARFRAVVLDPALLASAPPRVAAAAGIDALSHAVESFVTTRRNPVSQMLAREAWRRLEPAFERHLAAPGDLAAASDMLLGAHLAGAAIEASMLGAAHACANPLTEHYGLVHGVAIGLMLPHVVRWNAPAADRLYAELMPPGGRPADRLASLLETLREAAQLPSRLRDCGVLEDALPALAEDAAQQWTAGFNPRPVAAVDLLRLYREAF